MSVPSKLIVTMFLLGLCSNISIAQQDEDIISVIDTKSSITNLINDISLQMLMSIDLTSDVEIFEKKHLFPLINHLDYNVIGAGKSDVISSTKIVDFVVNKIDEGEGLDKISLLVVTEYEKGGFSISSKEQSLSKQIIDKISIGGYIVGEFEYHEEPIEEMFPLLAVNQVRVFFSSIIPSINGKNNIGVIAEWTPVPEEVIHHIDEVIYMSDTLSLGKFNRGGLMKFERLNIKIKNISGSGLDFTLGQFRVPFGIWSDYSSHRNYSTTKNNYIVNGFSLKKIELGAMMSKEFESGLTLKSAIVDGRKGRTSPLFREYNVDQFAWVSNINYTNNKLSVGLSSYFSEFNFSDRIAIGFDWLLEFNKLYVSGEFVYQQNNSPSLVYTDISTNVQNINSYAGYLQFDYAISPNIHFYGLYDLWALKIENQTVNQPTTKLFHGFRYYINNNLRWTVLEYGYMSHNDFDNRKHHISTQIEITF